MTPEELPPEVSREVTEYFASCVKRETEGGRRTFMNIAIDRNNFLPSELQREVDTYRGNTHQREFFLSQPEFISRLGRYLY
ncbi:MAG: hypothetical protein JW789_04910 [Candidatus Aenigmarchaeota archaeon]|nr:hypothetical protein [Candidatus Aenigmarchaeota archaeon]